MGIEAVVNQIQQPQHTAQSGTTKQNWHNLTKTNKTPRLM